MRGSCALPKSVPQERNELRAGSLITNKSHPCTAAVDLIAQRGLSWPEAKHNLLARRHPRWHPGEGTEPLTVTPVLLCISCIVCACEATTSVSNAKHTDA